MIEYDDKRNFYRMMLNSEVKLTVIDAEVNSVIIASCRDLSATGMAVEMYAPLALGVRVRVTIASANNNIESLDVKGKVVRVEEESPDLYIIGIAITDID
tara:strand:+ start:381 stop:680 length:300 start_codon:yes stop_codon:yes gene_type:complete